MKKPDEILNDFKAKLVAISGDKEKVLEIIDFVTNYADTYGPKIIPLIEQSIDLSKKIGYRDGEVNGYFNIYFASAVTQSGVKSKYLYAIPELTAMLESVKDSPDLYSFGLNYLAYFHWFKGEYEKGFNLAFEGIRNSEDKDLRNRGWHYFGLAIFYFDTKDFDNAKLYYQKAFDRFDLEKNKYGKGRSANGLASIAIIQDREEDALQLLEFASSVYREYGHSSGLSRALNDLGLLAKSKTNYLKAIEFLNESIELRIELNHVQGLITSYTERGEIYLLMTNFEAALLDLKKGLELALAASSQQKQVRIYKLLYDTYKQLNDTESALKNFELFFELKSQLLSDEASNSIKRIQTQFEKEKSEREAEIERLKNIELKKAYDLIEQKNEELHRQKLVIEEHQKEIIDSITYAKRIQDAILPPLELITEKLAHSFVLYKPKDIVAGDFYWLGEIDDTILIAAADCTGHGVPGAMVSVICSTALNRAVKEFALSDTGAILDKVTDLVIGTFEKSLAEVKDGMDISLLSVNKRSGEINWSGAHNPLWYLEEGELKELTADKQPIGKSDHRKSFTTQNIQCKAGSTFFLFTDGFADQFGGPRGKKFKYKQFSELLLSLNGRELSEQVEIIGKAFEDWKGDLEQVDDVCVIGVRV